MASAILKFCNSSSLLADLEGVTCPICLEIYEKPKKIPCGHIICRCCLASYEGVAEPSCPLCRKPFQLPAISKASDVEKLINGSKGCCKGCDKTFSISKLRSHHSICEKLQYKKAEEDLVQANDKVDIQSKITPNRHTFKCPYCGLENFDTNGLRLHATKEHANSPAKVVCPICSSMPWGDPTQTSTNFISHINMRHRFEYDTLVDFELDDDAALQRAIHMSMEEY